MKQVAQASTVKKIVLSVIINDNYINNDISFLEHVSVGVTMSGKRRGRASAKKARKTLTETLKKAKKEAEEDGTGDISYEVKFSTLFKSRG